MQRCVASYVSRGVRPSRTSLWHRHHPVSRRWLLHVSPSYDQYPISLFDKLHSFDHTFFWPSRSIQPHLMYMDAWTPSAPRTHTHWPTPVVTNTDADAEITLEVPGFKFDEIKITLEPTKHQQRHVLSIHGQSPAKTDSDATTRSFAHQFVLDEDVVWDTHKITAHLQDGILTVTVPKDVESMQRDSRTIPVTTAIVNEETKTAKVD